MKKFFVGLFLSVQYLITGAFLTLIEVPQKIQMTCGVREDTATNVVGVALLLVYALIFFIITKEEKQKTKVNTAEADKTA